MVNSNKKILRGLMGEILSDIGSDATGFKNVESLTDLSQLALFCADGLRKGASALQGNDSQELANDMYSLFQVYMSYALSFVSDCIEVTRTDKPMSVDSAPPSPRDQSKAVEDYLSKMNETLRGAPGNPAIMR